MLLYMFVCRLGITANPNGGSMKLKKCFYENKELNEENKESPCHVFNCL